MPSELILVVLCHLCTCHQLFEAPFDYGKVSWPPLVVNGPFLLNERSVCLPLCCATSNHQPYIHLCTCTGCGYCIGWALASTTMVFIYQQVHEKKSKRSTVETWIILRKLQQEAWCDFSSYSSHFLLKNQVSWPLIASFLLCKRMSWCLDRLGHVGTSRGRMNRVAQLSR